MTPDYKTHAPQGWMGDWKRGAPMGRPSILPDDLAAPYRITVSEILLDSDGDDPEGAYWGLNEPLYWYASDCGGVDAMLRATGIEAALAAVRAQFPNAVIDRAPDALDDFTRGYVACALWSSMDDDGNTLDAAHTAADIDVESLARMIADCAAFQRDHADLLAVAYARDPAYDAQRAGHDFWLTRNRHGVGYGDRHMGALGDALTNAAIAACECDLYIGDDDKIYLS